ncbi:MAG: hypothetical protein SV760_00165, partial [Halobacteria archaeon]|nr:hypothetical protein [Halobacteria archaeon]
SGVITARYAPAGWWETERSYTADQDTLLVKNSVTSIDVLTILIRFVGVLIPFLVITYFVDRGFGLDVWPPWRGI